MMDRILATTGRQGQEFTTKILAASLIGGVFALAPGIALALDAAGVGLLASSLLGLSIAGIQYAALAVYFRRIELALIIGLIVTMTMSANVPFGPPSERLLGLGPQLWLVHVPLAGLGVLYAITGRWRRIGLTRSHLLLGGAVLWMLVAAPLSAGPRTDIALYFVLLILQAFLVFVLATSAVRRNVVSFRQVVGVLTATVIGHSVLAAFQFLNGGPFGLTFLGESTGKAARIALGPIGTYRTGGFVTGFAGGGPYSTLVTFAAPLALVFAYRTRGWERAGWATGFVFLSATLRASGWDAGRGSYLLAMVTLATLAGALAIRDRNVVGRVRSKMRIEPIGLTLLVGMGAMFWPSSVAGSRTRTSNLAPRETQPESNGGAVHSNPNGSGVPNGSNGSSVPNGSTGNENPWTFEYFDPDPVLSSVDSLSIPLFDLSNLAVRLQQYVAGIDLFLQYPVFGIGGANFYFVSKSMGLKYSLPLHNMYLALLVETGLAGFLLYTAAIVSTLVASLRTMLRHRRDRPLVIAVLAGILGYLALMMLQVQLLRIEALLPFWLLAGALVGHSSVVEDEDEAD